MMRLDRRTLIAGLSATQLETLYGAPVEIVTDTAAGKSAFLPS
jgi:hypothetical protein